MSIRYEHFVKIKKDIGIMYAGHCSDYVTLLKVLRPFIENSLSNVKIHLACRVDLLYLLDGCDKVMSIDEFKKNINKFGFTKEIKGSLKSPHPIEKFLKESKIEVPVINQSSNSPSKLCCIFGEGSLPTKSLGKTEIERLKKMASYEGYDTLINPPYHTIEQAGWVISVENANLIESCLRGVKASLVPTGIGTSLLKKMFPSMSLLKKS